MVPRPWGHPYVKIVRSGAGHVGHGLRTVRDNAGAIPIRAGFEEWHNWSYSLPRIAMLPTDLHQEHSSRISFAIWPTAGHTTVDAVTQRAGLLLPGQWGERQISEQPEDGDGTRGIRQISQQVERDSSALQLSFGKATIIQPLQSLVRQRMPGTRCFRLGARIHRVHQFGPLLWVKAKCFW